MTIQYVQYVEEKGEICTMLCEDERPLKVEDDGGVIQFHPHEQRKREGRMDGWIGRRTTRRREGAGRRKVMVTGARRKDNKEERERE